MLGHLTLFWFTLTLMSWAIQYLPRKPQSPQENHEFCGFLEDFQGEKKFYVT